MTPTPLQIAETLGLPPTIAVGSGPVILGVELTTAQQACLNALVSGNLHPSRIAATKWEAGRRIAAAGFTDIAQRNWHAYSIRLLRKGTLTEEEEANAEFADQADRWINAVRAASDAIEATEGLSPFDPAAPWPPMPDAKSYRPCPKVF